MLRIAQDDEKRPQPRLAQVERGLKDRRGEIGPARSADRLAPDGELAGDVEQPPPCVAEAEHQRSLGEDLDLLRGGQHQADVPARPRGLGVADVRSRTGMNQRFAPLTGFRPPGHVDHPRQIALAIDQEDRPHAVAEPVKPFDRRQSGVEAGSSRHVLVTRGGRIVLRAQQERSGRDPPVLVSRQRGHPQRLERRRDPVGADRIEIVRDDQVLGLVLEPIEAMRQLLIEEPSKSEVDRLHDHLDHAALGRQERRRIARLEREVGSQPLDLNPETVRVVVQPVISLISGAVPVDDASIARHVELTVGKKVLERAPEHRSGTRRRFVKSDPLGRSLGIGTIGSRS